MGVRAVPVEKIPFTTRNGLTRSSVFVSSAQKPPKGGRQMAEKLAKLGVKREKDFLYYIKDGGVWKVKAKRAGQNVGKPEKVVDAGIDQRDTSFMYFLDKDGDVARSKRSVGGQRRKKTAKKAAPKKAAKKAAPKKAAKKPAKAAKKPAKKAGKKKR